MGSQCKLRDLDADGALDRAAAWERGAPPTRNWRILLGRAMWVAQTIASYVGHSGAARSRDLVLGESPRRCPGFPELFLRRLTHNSC